MSWNTWGYRMEPTELRDEARRLINIIIRHVTFQDKPACTFYFFGDDIADIAKRCSDSSVTTVEIDRLNKMAQIVSLHESVSDAYKQISALQKEEVLLRPVCKKCKRRVGTDGYYRAQDGRINGECADFPCEECRPHASRMNWGV